MASEIVVTSARRGVKPGRTGFQVVLCTRGMRDDLVAALERLAEYRHVHPAGSGRNPAIYAHRIISTSEGRFSVLSRTVDGGADFSSRSNKLAHCVALDEGEVAARRSVSPACLLLGLDELLVGRWTDDTPAQLPPRQLPTPNVDEGFCTTWKRLMGDAGWAGVLADRAIAGQPTVVVQSDCSAAASKQLLTLFAEAMPYVPDSRRWQVTFETLATPASQAVWRGTYVGSPELSALESAAHESAGGVAWIDLSKPRAVPFLLVTPRVDAARQGRPLQPRPVVSMIANMAARTNTPSGAGVASSGPPPLSPVGPPNSTAGHRPDGRDVAPAETLTKGSSRKASTRDDDDSWERRVGHGRDPGRHRWGALAAVGIILFIAVVALGVWQQGTIANWIQSLIPTKPTAEEAVQAEPAAQGGDGAQRPPDAAAEAFQTQKKEECGTSQEPLKTEKDVTIEALGQEIPIRSLAPQLVGVQVKVSGLEGGPVECVPTQPGSDDGRFDVRLGGASVGEVCYERGTGKLSFTLRKDAPPGLVRMLRQSATLIVSAQPSSDATHVAELAWISLADRAKVQEASDASWGGIREAMSTSGHLPLQSVIDKQGEPVRGESRKPAPRLKLLDRDCSDIDLDFALPDKFEVKRSKPGHDFVDILFREPGTQDGKPIAEVEWDREGIWFSWMGSGTAFDADACAALALSPLLIRPKNLGPKGQSWSYTALVRPSKLEPVTFRNLADASPRIIDPIPLSGPALLLQKSLGDPTRKKLEGLVASDMRLVAAPSPDGAQPKISMGKVRSTTKQSVTQVWRCPLESPDPQPSSGPVIGTVRIDWQLESAQEPVLPITVTSKGWGDCYTRGLDLQDLHGNQSDNDVKLLGGRKQENPILEVDFEKVFFGLLVDAGIIQKGQMRWAVAAKEYGPKVLGLQYTHTQRLALRDWMAPIRDSALRPEGEYFRFVAERPGVREKPKPPGGENNGQKTPNDDSKEAFKKAQWQYEEDLRRWIDEVTNKADDVEMLDDWIAEEKPRPEEAERIAASIYRWAKDMPAAKVRKDDIKKVLEDATLRIERWNYSLDWSREKIVDGEVSSPLRVVIWSMQDGPRGAAQP